MYLSFYEQQISQIGRFKQHEHNFVLWPYIKDEERQHAGTISSVFGVWRKCITTILTEFEQVSEAGASYRSLDTKYL